MFEELSQRVPGITGSQVLQYGLTFVVIFAAMALVALLLRRIAGRRRPPVDAAVTEAGERGRRPRLGIVDVYEMDAQRSLILLRRDDVEHLLLVGGPNDLVVERDIARATARSNVPVLESPPAVPVTPADRPATRAEPTLPSYPPAQPDRDFPEVVPPPRRIPADEGVPAGQASATLGAAPATEQGRLAPDALSDMARQLEAALATAPMPAQAPPASTKPATSGIRLAKEADPDPAPASPVRDGLTEAVPATPPVAPHDAAGNPGSKPRPSDIPAMTWRPHESGAPSTGRAASGADIFSVEEIEAEFSRLLGRNKDATGEPPDPAAGDPRDPARLRGLGRERPRMGDAPGPW